jgi:hypothetical protein
VKQIVIALLVVIFAVFLLTPVAGAEMSCGELCIEIGDENLEECVQMCEEYLSEDGKNKCGPICLLKVVENCNLSLHNVIEFIKLVTKCTARGFKGSECSDNPNLCGLTNSCMDSICGSGPDKDGCMKAWEKKCKK